MLQNLQKNFKMKEKKNKARLSLSPLISACQSLITA